MYGTIARITAKPGALEALKEMEKRHPAGYIASYIYQMDANPGELWMVVLFENKEAYFANAESAEQDREYRQVRQFMASDPEWHDGGVVFDSHSIHLKG
jgi:quinol monooxygenase YgiN